LPVVDGLLAATARVHDLTLVTRSVKDVVRTGIDVLDPFAPTAR
jgi:predicted nucleic acid-binding protein